jgi:hypothetical protein
MQSAELAPLNAMVEATRNLLIVTPTYDRPLRTEYLTRCVASFAGVAGLHWLVVEDAAERDPRIAQLLARSRIAHTYLAIGPTGSWGNAQRDLALRHIRDTRMDGIVYLADDDNYCEGSVVAELRRVRRAGVMPVGLLGPFGIERPIVRGGRIVDWSAHWKSRRFPVDMAAFAFDAALLRDIEGPIWTYAARGGETEFLEKLVGSPEALEILCDGCRRCHVWHDLPLTRSPARALLEYRLGRSFHFLRDQVARPLLARLRPPIVRSPR